MKMSSGGANLTRGDKIEVDFSNGRGILTVCTVIGFRIDGSLDVKRYDNGKMEVVSFNDIVCKPSKGDQNQRDRRRRKLSKGLNSRLETTRRDQAEDMLADHLGGMHNSGILPTGILSTAREPVEAVMEFGQLWQGKGKKLPKILDSYRIKFGSQSILEMAIRQRKHILLRYILTNGLLSSGRDDHIMFGLDDWICTIYIAIEIGDLKAVKLHLEALADTEYGVRKNGQNIIRLDKLPRQVERNRTFGPIQYARLWRRSLIERELLLASGGSVTNDGDNFCMVRCINVRRGNFLGDKCLRIPLAKGVDTAIKDVKRTLQEYTGIAKCEWRLEACHSGNKSLDKRRTLRDYNLDIGGKDAIMNAYSNRGPGGMRAGTGLYGAGKGTRSTSSSGNRGDPDGTFNCPEFACHIIIEYYKEINGVTRRRLGKLNLCEDTNGMSLKKFGDGRYIMKNGKNKNNLKSVCKAWGTTCSAVGVAELWCKIKQYGTVTFDLEGQCSCGTECRAHIVQGSSGTVEKIDLKKHNDPSTGSQCRDPCITLDEISVQYE